MQLLKPKWKQGRQPGIEYHKLCLFSFKLGRWGFDAYILRYPAKTVLPWHTDPVNGKHYRINIKLRGKCTFFAMPSEDLDNIGDISIGEFLHIFRPDKQLHSLVVFKKTYKLSLGLVKFNRK